MSLAIVGKFGAALTFTTTSALITVVIIDKERFGIYSDVHVFAISNAVVNGSKDNNFDATNYHCKFAGSTNTKESFECSVQKLKDDSKKHYDINKLFTNWSDTIKTDGGYTEAISDSDLAAANNLFQIKFLAKFWDKGNNAGKNIEIVKKSSTNVNQKFADLKQLVSVYDGKSNEKTGYFVGKADKTISDATTPSDFKCTFKDDAAADKNKDCTIKLFSDDNQDSSTDYKTLTFTKQSNATTTITKDKYYLIQFTNSSDHKQISTFKQNIIYAHATDKTKSVEFKNVKTVVYDDKKDHIFSF